MDDRILPSDPPTEETVAARPPSGTSSPSERTSAFETTTYVTSGQTSPNPLPTISPASDPSDDLRLAPRLRGYRITGTLGRGGMGVVWRAEQISARRSVALKVMAAASFSSERSRLRFEREVELTARLDHPGIARLFESGIEGEVCYYAMELVEGATRLDDWARAQKLDDRRAISLFRQVCEAVQDAHQKGIIHRDLKPSNVMVDKDGHAKVLDFGLGKALEADSGLSLDGDIAGTPAYMSPEQASGHANTADTRSDVYSLGVILYNLLTHQHPHDLTGSALEIMKRVADQDILPPKKARPDLDPDVAAILTKTLSREPNERYPSAGALADDLQNFLSGDSVEARSSAGSLYYFRKRVKKYRGRIATAAAILALLLGTAVWSYVDVTRQRNAALAAERNERSARDQATEQARIAESARRQEAAAAENERVAKNDAKRHAETARRELYIGTIGLAEAMIKEGDYQRARELLASCPADLRNWEWGYLRRTATEETYPIPLSGRAVGLNFSPRSDLLIIATSHRLETWDFNDLPPERIASRQISDEITALALDPAGDRIGTTQRGGTIRLWNAYSLEQIGGAEAPYPIVKSLAFLPEHAGLVVLSGSGKVFVMRATDAAGKPMLLDSGNEFMISIGVSGDGKYIAGGCKSEKMRVWDLATGKVHLFPRLQQWQAQPIGLAFLRGGAGIAYVTSFDTLGVRDCTTGVPIWAQGVPGAKPVGLASAADSSRLAVAYDRGVALFDPLANGARTRILRGGDREGARTPAVSRDGRFTAGVFGEQLVRVWAMSEGFGTDRSMDGYSVNAIAVDPTSQRIAYHASGEHPMIVEPDGTRRNLTARHPPSSGFSASTIAWTRSGDRLAYSVSGGVAIFDARTGAAITEFETNSDAMRLTFADRDRLLITAFLDRTVVGWNLQTGRRQWETKADGGITSIVTCPSNDAEFVVSRYQRGTVIAGVRDGLALRPFPSDGPNAALAFSADGHTLYGNRNGGSLFALDWPSCRTRWKKVNPNGDSSSAAVAVSPDGRRIAEAHDDRTIHLWDADHGRELLALAGIPSIIYALTWSADGRDLVVGNQGAGRQGMITWHGLKTDLATGRYEQDVSPGATVGNHLLIPQGTVIDLLPIARGDLQVGGRWSGRGKFNLQTTDDRARIPIPVAPHGGYEVTAILRRMSGNGIVFILPHPSGEVVSAFDVPNPSGGEASGATGLSRIDGLGSFDPSYTGTRLGEVLKTGRTHTVIARVAPGIDGTVRITVGLDGNELYSWEGPSKSLSLFPAWKINQPRWPAIGAYRGTTVEFDKLDMKILDGDATVYAPPAAATQSASQPAGTTGPTTLPAK